LPVCWISIIGGLLSVALSVDILRCRPGITWQRARWSPDFPRGKVLPRDRPTDNIQYEVNQVLA
jgi:hypothetical protein